jgi:aminopeptidase N
MRKPIALFLLGFLATTSLAENNLNRQPGPAPLPLDVVPRSYLIHLEPDIDNLTIEGVEAIGIEVLRPTNRIVLNALDTQIEGARIEAANFREELTARFDSNQQTVSFELNEALTPGPYTLSIKFQSKIAETPHGLFIQHHHDQTLGTVAYSLSTELQAGDARRLFPSWDQPAFRATFQLSVKTEKPSTVVSNMPVFVEQPLGPNQKIVVFEKTPSMACHELFLVCGKLESIENEVTGVRLRILTTAGKKDSGKYAMEVTRQLLPYFTDYFAAPVPFSKLDQVALPSDTDNAVGKWGGNVYDEGTLLCDLASSSESTRQKIFLAIAHEVAWHWCASLMPDPATNDRWLAEGLPSFMAKTAAEHFNPNWKIWLHTALKKEEAMAVDAGEMTHSLQYPNAGGQWAHYPADVITTQKPWLLLRMLENFTGEDPLRDSLRACLTTREKSSSTSEDLWASLEGLTNKPIKKIVTGWTEQPGFPLIKVTSQCLNGNRVISLEQVPFAIWRRDESPTQWKIPVGIRSTLNSNEARYALLDKLSNNFDLVGCNGVLQANAGNTGYFRVLYEPALFNDLLRTMEKLPESDRLNLVTDTWALVESGQLPASTYFELLEDLRGDDSFAVWQSALGTDENTGALKLIDHLEQGRPGREAYQKYICSLLAPKFQRLGWNEKAGEEDETRSYRAMLIETLGFFGDRDVIDESFKRFESYREDPSSLSPYLQAAVMAIVGRYSSQTINHELLSMASNATSVEERRICLRALGAALDPDSARETMDYLLSSSVDPADASLALETLAAEGEHPGIAWSFVVDHPKEIQERFATSGQSRFLSSIASGSSDDGRADEILAFAQANLPAASLAEVENSINEIRFRAKLKAKTLPAIDDWIKAKFEKNQYSTSRGP